MTQPTKINSSSADEPIFKPFELKRILRVASGEAALRKMAQSGRPSQHSIQATMRMIKNGPGYGNNTLS